MTFAEQILQFNTWLSSQTFELPLGFEIINPFNGEQHEKVKQTTTLFYKKYYNDNRKRRLILGSSPARKGTAVTGVPFEDSQHLQNETGIFIDEFYINKRSSDFLYDVMNKYGRCKKFYDDFYLNFVFPLGIIKTNSKGNKVNCNYYENKELREKLYSFIIKSLQLQLAFGIDTSVCYCIGSSENYKFLLKINKEYKFFDEIIPLEHPRFIMQYNSKQKDTFIEKYLNALNNK